MASPRILLALKDGTRQDLCCARLIEEGFAVAVAGSGLACLEALRRLAPDVLILEHALPWGGGDGVLDRMRTDRSLPGVPLILLLSWPAGVRELSEDVSSPGALLSRIRQCMCGAPLATVADRETRREPDSAVIRPGER